MKGIYFSETVKKTKNKISSRNPTLKELKEKKARTAQEAVELASRIKKRSGKGGESK